MCEYWLTSLTYFYLSTGSITTLQSKRPPDQSDTTKLRHKAVQFLANSLPTTTRATYAARQQRFAVSIKPLMLPQSQLEHTLLLFKIHLATSNIAHTTIKIYISAIRHIHVSTELHAQFNSQLTPRLQLILKEKVSKETRQFPTQEFVYQLSYKLCNPSMTSSSTNPIHTPTS